MSTKVFETMTVKGPLQSTSLSNSRMPETQIFTLPGKRNRPHAKKRNQNGMGRFNSYLGSWKSVKKSLYIAEGKWHPFSNWLAEQTMNQDEDWKKPLSNTLRSWNDLFFSNVEEWVRGRERDGSRLFQEKTGRFPTVPKRQPSTGVV